MKSLMQLTTLRRDKSSIRSRRHERLPLRAMGHPSLLTAHLLHGNFHTFFRVALKEIDGVGFGMSLAENAQRAQRK
jgi:hypothetical protein